MTRSYCEDDVGRREGWAAAVETGTYGRQLCLTVFSLPACHGNVAAGGIGCCDVTPFAQFIQTCLDGAGGDNV